MKPTTMQVKTTPEKITIQKEGVKTTIIPTSEEGKFVTKTASVIQSGIPSNKDLDELGDKIWDFLEQAKKGATDVPTGKLAENTQNVVSDIQEVVREKNYDERLQEITRKLKEAPRDVSGVSMEFRNDAERIRDKVREILPNLYGLARALIGDYKFRDLIVTLFEVLQNSYDRTQGGTPDVSETLKEDIRDVNQERPERTKEALKWKYENMRRYMTLTEDEKEKLLSKFCSTLLKLRGNREYYDFVENSFKLYDELVEIWDKVNDRPGLGDFYCETSSIMHDIRVLFERSAGRNLDRWCELVKDLGRAKDDQRFISMRRDLEELLFDRERRLQTEEQIKEHYFKIKSELEELNNAYDNVFDELSFESRCIVNGITEDPLISKMRRDIDTLFRDVFTDTQGKPTGIIASDAALKIRNVFFPILKEKLSFISLPIIVIESENYFFRIENFNLSLPQMLPDQLQIESDSNIKIDIDKMKRKGNINLKISFYPINADIKRLKFTLNKKTGIKYHDYGVVDIKLRDCGLVLYFTVNLEADNVDRIELTKVDSNFDGLKIKILDSRHDVIDKIITSLFIPILRGRVKTAVDDSLMDTINYGFFEQINSTLRSVQEKSFRY